MSRRTGKQAPKRPTRKANNKNVVNNKLPDLEEFLVQQNQWPDVTDILAGDAFKEAMDQFSKIAEFRTQLKENLTTCYGRRRMPRTPKKLVHKAPPMPIQRTIRYIDFEMNMESDVSAHSTIIAVNEVVPQTPLIDHQKHSVHKNANNDLSEKSAGHGMASFSRLFPNTDVIEASQPPLNRTQQQAAQNNFNSPVRSPMFLKTRAAMTLPASATRPVLFAPATPRQNKNVQSTPKHPANEKDQLEKLNQKLAEADIRHKEFIRDQATRVARDYEIRKKRVNQNLQHKQQERERELEHKRQQQERLRIFEEAQRSPKTPLKTLAKPLKLLTPGQKAVPKKRSKLKSGPTNLYKPTQIPVPRARLPAFIANQKERKSPSPLSVHNPQENEQDESVIIEEELSVEKTALEPASTQESSLVANTMEDENGLLPAVVDKENHSKNAQPAASSPQAKLEESVYDMTPEKVFQPSTENDYNVNDLSSGDETDNEDNPRKKVPGWAEKGRLRQDVQRLFRQVSKDAVNAYFGVLRPPKLATLFASNNKKYDMTVNETTTWDSPIANPRSAPLTNKANQPKK